MLVVETTRGRAVNVVFAGTDVVVSFIFSGLIVEAVVPSAVESGNRVVAVVVVLFIAHGQYGQEFSFTNMTHLHKMPVYNKTMKHNNFLIIMHTAREFIRIS